MNQPNLMTPALPGCSSDEYLLQSPGNFGRKGIEAFFGTHQCNGICRALKLTNVKSSSGSANGIQTGPRTGLPPPSELVLKEFQSMQVLDVAGRSSTQLSAAESVSTSRIHKFSEAAKHHMKLRMKLLENNCHGDYSKFHDTIKHALEEGLISEGQARKYHEIRLKGNEARHVFE